MNTSITLFSLCHSKLLLLQVELHKDCLSNFTMTAVKGSFVVKQERKQEMNAGETRLRWGDLLIVLVVAVDLYRKSEVKHPRTCDVSTVAAWE